MQKAQRIIKTYRRNRMIVCTICALVTLASTLSVRFISQRNLNQQRVEQFELMLRQAQIDFAGKAHPVSGRQPGDVAHQ